MATSKNLIIGKATKLESRNEKQILQEEEARHAVESTKVRRVTGLDRNTVDLHLLLNELCKEGELVEEKEDSALLLQVSVLRKVRLLHTVYRRSSSDTFLNSEKSCRPTTEVSYF